MANLYNNTQYINGYKCGFAFEEQNGRYVVFKTYRDKQDELLNVWQFNLHNSLDICEKNYNSMVDKFNGEIKFIIKDTYRQGNVATFNTRADARRFIEDYINPHIVELKLLGITDEFVIY